MPENRLTVLLCRSAAPTLPEGIAIIGAGLTTRPPDGNWMAAGVFDGWVYRDPEVRTTFGLQVFDDQGVEVILDGDEGDVPQGPPKEGEGTLGRLFILLDLPAMDQLTKGLYTLRITTLGASQDIHFAVSGPEAHEHKTV
jgi:hypothetical protein